MPEGDGVLTEHHAVEAQGQSGVATLQRVELRLGFARVTAIEPGEVEPVYEFGRKLKDGPDPSHDDIRAFGGHADLTIRPAIGRYPTSLFLSYAYGSGDGDPGDGTFREFHNPNNDTALIQASTNGTTWVTVWPTSAAVSDNSWLEVQHTLPAGFGGSPSVRVRWGLASNPSQNAIGWNIDDVELLGHGRASCRLR